MWWGVFLILSTPKLTALESWYNGMTFVERYRIADRWQDKVLVMNLYHTAATEMNDGWTIKQTATVFEVSIGLVSENLRLADAIDKGSDITKCATRQEALTKVDRRKAWQPSY